MHCENIAWFLGVMLFLPLSPLSSVSAPLSLRVLLLAACVPQPDVDWGHARRIPSLPSLVPGSVVPPYEYVEAA